VPCMGYATLPIGGRPVGGVLAQTSLVLPPCVVPQEDLDRGASCDRTPRVSGTDPRSGRGRSRAGRPRRDGAVSRVAVRPLGVGWADDHAESSSPAAKPIIDDPRHGPGTRGRRRSGWDEDCVLAAPPDSTRRRVCDRGIADLTPGRPGRRAAGGGRRPGPGWLAGRLACPRARTTEWERRQIATASLDPVSAGYATALNQQLPPRGFALLDPFHVTKARADPRSTRCAAGRAARCPTGPSGSSWRPASTGSAPASLRRRADRLSEAGLGFGCGAGTRPPATGGGQVTAGLDHRPGPDALLPAPRRQRRGSSHHRRPRLAQFPENRPPEEEHCTHGGAEFLSATSPHNRDVLPMGRPKRLKPEDQEHQAHRAPRIPQLRQLPAPPPSQPRPNPEQSSGHHGFRNPPSQLGGVEAPFHLVNCKRASFTNEKVMYLTIVS